MSAERRDEDGFLLDEWDQAWGVCNACWEEVQADGECCQGGEVVPHD